MAWLVYSIKNAEGYCAAHGFEERIDWTKQQLIAHVMLRVSTGSVLLDLEGGAVHPPERIDPLTPKRVRLAELRSKGWANLTVAEREEARGLVFDLGGSP